MVNRALSLLPPVDRTSCGHSPALLPFPRLRPYFHSGPGTASMENDEEMVATMGIGVFGKQRKTHPSASSQDTVRPTVSYSHSRPNLTGQLPVLFLLTLSYWEFREPIWPSLQH